MKKVLFIITLILTIISASVGQPPLGPPSANQTPDIIISVSTLNTDLVYKVNGRDRRLYQSYLGSKLDNISELKQARDAEHLAYATSGTDNLFEPAIRMDNGLDLLKAGKVIQVIIS